MGYLSSLSFVLLFFLSQSIQLKIRIKISYFHFIRYGGPGSQAVDYRFSIGYETYLASSENAVYAYLDGRGTASRGQDFKYLLYKRMATYEVEDQIIGARLVIFKG